MKKHALLASTALAISLLFAPAAWSQISVSVELAPPPLPDYAQPPAPADGYIWTPGYWAWSPQDRDYYWVPGTWVLAPEPGDLWTPGYWAYEDSGYFWHPGYWGPQVGFYGGLNYGFGYYGTGYVGGRWDRGVFRYNRAVTNVNTRIVHNVYNTPVQHNNRPSRVSFNGGRGGLQAHPTSAQRQFQAEHHPGPSADQMQHEHAAMSTPTQRATGPHGVPQVAATPRPSGFEGQGVEHMRPGRSSQPERPQARPQTQAPEHHQERPQERPQERLQGHPQPAPQIQPQREQPHEQPHSPPPQAQQRPHEQPQQQPQRQEGHAEPQRREGKEDQHHEQH